MIARFPAYFGNEALHKLSKLALRLQDALVAWQTALVAVDNFQLEELSCQWRLDALDAQLALLEEAKKPSDELADDVEDDVMEEVDPWAENHRRVVAMEHCLKILATQQEGAISALRKRAAQYVVPSLNEITDANEDTVPHLENHLHAAKTIYCDIEEETRAIIEVVPDSDVGRLYGHFWRRRAFWSSELEDVGVASTKATECMQQARTDVAQVWTEIAVAVDTHTISNPSGMSSDMKRILTKVIRMGLQLELLELDGIVRLDINCSDEDAASQSSRAALLDSTFKVLEDADVLHKVGALFLQDSQVRIPRLPHPHLEMALATARSVIDAKHDVNLDIVSEYTGISGQWVSWLARCFIAVMADASQRGDIRTACSMFALCEALGGISLACAIYESGCVIALRKHKASLQPIGSTVLAPGAPLVSKLPELLSETRKLSRGLPKYGSLLRSSKLSLKRSCNALFQVRSSPALTSKSRIGSGLFEVKSAISLVSLDSFVEDTCGSPKQVLSGRFDSYFLNLICEFSFGFVSLTQSSEPHQVK